MIIDRRQFLCKSAITAVGLGLASPLLERAAFGNSRRKVASRASTDTLVVALNLYGGNDGLNTVIPVSQYGTYKGYRPTLAIPQDRTLALEGTSDLALNPGMTALRDLYNAGKVAIVAGVGAPQSSQGLFDHEAQQREMQSADPMQTGGSLGQSGWLGRFLDTTVLAPDAILPPGVDLGGGRLVVDGNQIAAISLTSVGEFRLNLGFDAEARSAVYARMMQHAAQGGPAEWNRVARKAAVVQAEVLQSAVENYVPMATYPDNPVSVSLLQCAELVAADLNVRAITVGYNGFDTHAAQNDRADGEPLGFHDLVLQDVSSAVAAFYADLDAHGLADRVIVLVFSEFGRRPRETNDGGTDHGYGSVWFVVGGAVKGGVYGEYPSIAPSSLVLDGNVAVTTDFRSVYATIIAKHMGGDPGPILGADVPLLGFL